MEEKTNPFVGGTTFSVANRKSNKAVVLQNVASLFQDSEHCALNAHLGFHGKVLSQDSL